MDVAMKTPIYVRNAQKRYRDKNKDLINAKARSKYTAQKEQTNQQTNQQKKNNENNNIIVFTIDDLINGK
jgi:hypothetical protein